MSFVNWMAALSVVPTWITSGCLQESVTIVNIQTEWAFYAVKAIHWCFITNSNLIISFFKWHRQIKRVWKPCDTLSFVNIFGDRRKTSLRLLQISYGHKDYIDYTDPSDPCAYFLSSIFSEGTFFVLQSLMSWTNFYLK